MMLDILEKEINKLNLFQGNTLEIVTAIADSIPSQTIPYRMKMALAISEIVLFTSQFRINIKHWNGSIIPINSIMFCIAKSGAAKDSSLKAARKCFGSGYDIINEHRKQSAINQAVQKATEAGCDVPDNFACYKDYYFPPNPLFAAISTSEGFIQHLNDLANDTIGSGFLSSSELGAELCSSPNLTDNIKLISELYDEGNKDVKLVKARENQSREVRNLPVSALFMGSQDNILFDDSVKKKFKTEFTSKLARRSFFVFVNEDMAPEEYSSIEEMLEKERTIEDNAIRNRNEVDSYIRELTGYLLERGNTTIDVAEKVRDLFVLYKKYNEAIASTIEYQFPITKLTRAHLQWKALKLSGAFALIQDCERIELEHYKAAIEFVELINNDVSQFEKEMTKESYELFTNYAHMYAVDGEFSIGLHALKKAGFITGKVNSDSCLNELVKLANSCDENGIYSVKKDMVHFKVISKTDTILLSYLKCSGTKEQRAKSCAEGYVCEELMFPDLEEMLKGDYAYSPFRFLNGSRGKYNIDSGCKWIVLDVDDSEVTDEEAHILLSDLNHYIVRTSNRNNSSKYRVLLELDMEVDIPDIHWIPFIREITTDLGLKADQLAKSQIFFSYSDRNILKTLDEKPLAVKPYLNALNTSKPVAAKTPSKKACNAMLDDPFTTFDRAFNAPDGSGRRRLIWACRRARELGADRDYCKNLLVQVTDYWVKHFPEKDLDAMKRQLDRWSFQ